MDPPFETNEIRKVIRRQLVLLQECQAQLQRSRRECEASMALLNRSWGHLFERMYMPPSDEPHAEPS